MIRRYKVSVAIVLILLAASATAGGKSCKFDHQCSPGYCLKVAENGGRECVKNGQLSKQECKYHDDCSRSQFCVHIGPISALCAWEPDYYRRHLQFKLGRD